MALAAGSAARAVDAFAPLSDLLGAALAALWPAGAAPERRGAGARRVRGRECLPRVDRPERRQDVVGRRRRRLRAFSVRSAATGGAVALALDQDGDGAVDATLPTTWVALHD
jgi:hypothetical protein